MKTLDEVLNIFAQRVHVNCLQVSSVCIYLFFQCGHLLCSRCCEPTKKVQFLSVKSKITRVIYIILKTTRVIYVILYISTLKFAFCVSVYASFDTTFCMAVF